MKETYVIGIDYGTDSVRALLADAATGETIADSVFSYPRWGRQEYCSPAEARFRQHPQDYLDGLRHVIGEVVAARPDAAPHIRAVSVDTTASTPCLVDRTCTPLALRPEYADDPDAMFVLWKDHTAQRESEEITALCARSEINYARHSGNHYSAECFWAKCLHLLRGSRRLRRDAYAMVELCDWIPAVLTGADNPSAIRASHCAAGSKQMWAEAWGGFPPEAFFEALDPALLPIVRNISKTNRTCDHAAGTITPAWAQTLGLPEGVVVGVGNIDAHAGAVGAGIRCGTNKLVLCDLDNLLLGPDGNLTQVVRDVLQLFSSRGGRFTVFSQRTPKAVRAILGSVRLSAPALVCGGTLAYHFADGSRQPLCSFAGQDAGLFASLPSAAGVGIALQMQDGSTRVLRMSHALEQHLQQEWTPYLLANAADIRPDEVLRALVYQDNRCIPLTSLLEKALGDSTTALLGERAAPDLLRLTPRTVSGAEMLQAVCTPVGIAPENVLVLAGSMPMLELVRAASRSAAAADAPAELRLAAKQVTLTDAAGGAAVEVLYRMVRDAEKLA